MTLAIIWEYLVRENKLQVFEAAYRSDGLWAQLFRRADGYLSTDLHRDVENPLRFITIDYWTSQEAAERFFETYAQEYHSLDAVCADYTLTEHLVGRFQCDRW